VSLVGDALAARLLPCSAQKEIAFGNFGFPNAISFWDVVEMRAWRVRSVGGLAAA
jgi:hypothetical protein